MADNSVYDQLGPEFTELSIVRNSHRLGCSASVHKTLSGTTSFTYTNDEIGMVKDLVISDINNWPNTKIIAGEYDTSTENFIQIVKTASAEYFLSIATINAMVIEKTTIQTFSACLISGRMKKVARIFRLHQIKKTMFCDVVTPS